MNTNDISIVRGTTNKFLVTINDADGAPYALTADEQLIFGVKNRAESKNYKLKKILFEEVPFYYTVLLEPNDTIDLDFGTYFYDIGLQGGKEFYNIIPTSQFIVEKNITKYGDANG